MPDLSNFNVPVVALVIAIIGIVILLIILVWYIVMRSTFRKKVYAKIIDTAKRPVRDKKKKKTLTPQEQIAILKKGDPLEQVTYQYSPIYDIFKLNTVKKIYIDPNNPEKLFDLRFYRANLLRAGIMGIILIAISAVLIIYFQ